MPAGQPYKMLDSRDLIATFDTAMNGAEETLWSTPLCMEIPSSRETEELGWLGSVPVMRRWIGGRAEVTLNKYTLSVTNYPYEATLPISIDDQRRDKTGMIQARIADLATRTATHWNKLVGAQIYAGGGSTIGLAYDGKDFFDDDHDESGTNQINEISASQVASLNTSSATVPTAAEAALFISDVIAYMASYTDDQGEPINQNITGATILTTAVPIYSAIKQATSSMIGTLANSTSVIDNPLRAWNYNFNVINVPNRVTNTASVFYLFLTGGGMQAPFVRTNEQPVTVRIKDEIFEARRQLFGVDAVRGLAYGAWQRAAKCTLS